MSAGVAGDRARQGAQRARRVNTCVRPRGGQLKRQASWLEHKLSKQTTPLFNRTEVHTEVLHYPTVEDGRSNGRQWQRARDSRTLGQSPQYECVGLLQQLFGKKIDVNATSQNVITKAAAHRASTCSAAGRCPGLLATDGFATG